MLNSSINKDNIRVLSVSMNAWNDGDMNTLPILFQLLNPDNVYSIFCRTEYPAAHRYKHFLQISEISIIKKNFRQSEQVCKIVENDEDGNCINAIQENKIKNIYKLISNAFIALIRDSFWCQKFWAEDLLKQFVDASQANIVFVNVSSCIRTNKIALWASLRLGVPVVLLFGDDNLSYKSIPKLPFALLYKFWVRKAIFKLVDRASTVFVVSPKMKTEYDSLLHRSTILLSKPIDSILPYSDNLNSPMKLLYCGNLLYGRDDVLIKLVEALRLLNNPNIFLEIFTQTPLSEKKKNKLNSPYSIVNSAIPRKILLTKIENSDILVFPESDKRKYCRATRLSFSTKLTDYLASGKIIFSIGPKDIAPIEYLVQNDLSFNSSCNVKDILRTLDDILNNKSARLKKMQNIATIVKNNHSTENINTLLISALANNEENFNYSK